MRVALALVLAACGGSPKPAPEPSAPPTSSMLDCTKVAKHVAATIGTNPTFSNPGITPGQIEELVTTHCDADKWGDATKQCLFAITTAKQGRECAPTMTEEQRVAIKTAAQQLRKATGGISPDHEADWIRHVVQDQPDDVPR